MRDRRSFVNPSWETSRRGALSVEARIKQQGHKSNMQISDEVQSFRQSILDEDFETIRRAVDANRRLVGSHVNEHRQAFCFACEQGKLNAAKLLVELGADPREDNDFSVTRSSLHHPHVLKWLMDEFEIDPNIVTGDNWGPLILCPCETLNVDCIEVLLQRGADPNLIIPGADQQMKIGSAGRTSTLRRLRSCVRSNRHWSETAVPYATKK